MKYWSVGLHHSITPSLRHSVLFFLLTLSCMFGGRLTSQAADENQLLTRWLNSQADIHTWSADLVQTRALKSFTQPLVSEGHVSFIAPNRFRWELGNPPQTIAVRQADQMLIVYPKLKRVEKYPLTGEQTGPWKDALALLEAGFPRSQKELDSRFRVQSVTTTNGVCEVTLQPKSASARRMMPQIKIAFGANDFSLRATELQFADGSTMRNDFKNPKVNEKLDENLFSPVIGSDFKVVEPLKQKP